MPNISEHELALNLYAQRSWGSGRLMSQPIEMSHICQQSTTIADWTQLPLPTAYQKAKPLIVICVYGWQLKSHLNLNNKCIWCEFTSEPNCPQNYCRFMSGLVFQWTLYWYKCICNSVECLPVCWHCLSDVFPIIRDWHVKWLCNSRSQTSKSQTHWPDSHLLLSHRMYCNERSVIFGDGGPQALLSPGTDSNAILGLNV